MNWFIAIPMEVRLILLFAAGTALGAMANLAICGLAWNPRPISPWMRPNPSAPARRWSDRLPIFGWLGLRREASVHGSGFWIRPLLVELICGLGLAGLYYWEIGVVALFPADMPKSPNPALPPNLPFILHEQYVVHAILIWLMLVASLIDVDEKTIPDAVSRPGTLVGLFLAAVWPWSLLPDVYMQVPGKWDFKFLCVTTPNSWPAWLDGAPNCLSLAIALACWTLWCLAILPRTWFVRHGWLRALGLCWTRVVRQADTYWILCMGLVGALLCVLVWYRGGDNWKALLSALVGMAVGGGIIWIVRVIGRAVLNQEAMGFGDVTLMSMIGAFLGWQACIIVFFLSPFAALVVGLLRYLFLRDREIPFGPFLCLAALAVILYWAPIWDWAWGIFAMGWILALVMLACLPIFALLLFLLRMIFNAIHAWRG
ncbi:MAG: A24 family peptidase [Thermoguttaceae bacterium]|jgi:prepilin signal peptidase PulO-like enzyme (type II secretory pathway)